MRSLVAVGKDLARGQRDGFASALVVHRGMRKLNIIVLHHLDSHLVHFRAEACLYSNEDFWFVAPCLPRCTTLCLFTHIRSDKCPTRHLTKRVVMRHMHPQSRECEELRCRKVASGETWIHMNAFERICSKLCGDPGVRIWNAG